MAVLQAQDWPGNARQLRNSIERLLILVGGDPEAVITAEMLPGTYRRCRCRRTGRTARI